MVPQGWRPDGGGEADSTTVDTPGALPVHADPYAMEPAAPRAAAAAAIESPWVDEKPSAQALAVCTSEWFHWHHWPLWQQLAPGGATKTATATATAAASRHPATAVGTRG